MSTSLARTSLGELGASGVTQLIAGEIVAEVFAEPDIELDNPELDIILDPDSIDIELDVELDIEIDEGA